MGIEFKIDKTNPLEVFPDFPKTWDEMTDKQIEFWLKQLARFGGSEEDIKDKLPRRGTRGMSLLKIIQNLRAPTLCVFMGMKAIGFSLNIVNLHINYFLL